MLARINSQPSYLCWLISEISKLSQIVRMINHHPGKMMAARAATHIPQETKSSTQFSICFKINARQELTTTLIGWKAVLHLGLTIQTKKVDHSTKGWKGPTWSYQAYDESFLGVASRNPKKSSGSHKSSKFEFLYNSYIVFMRKISRSWSYYQKSSLWWYAKSCLDFESST